VKILGREGRVVGRDQVVQHQVLDPGLRQCWLHLLPGSGCCADGRAAFTQTRARNQRIHSLAQHGLMHQNVAAARETGQRLEKCGIGREGHGLAPRLEAQRERVGYRWVLYAQRLDPQLLIRKSGARTVAVNSDKLVKRPAPLVIDPDGIVESHGREEMPPIVADALGPEDLNAVATARMSRQCAGAGQVRAGGRNADA
jgi:hypothetical protein